MATNTDCNNEEINGADHGDAGNDSFLFMSFLDEVEDRVEELRKNALSLSQEKASLLAIISQLKDDRPKYALSEEESREMLSNIELLKRRCETVDINITTLRTTEQESSFLLVNSLVTKLEHMCWLGNSDDGRTCVHQAQGYLNACVSDGSSDGPIDYKFQGMILGCNLTDQKHVRQRLECLAKGSCHEDFIVQRLDDVKQFPNESISVNEEKHQDDLNSQISLPSDIASSEGH